MEEKRERKEKERIEVKHLRSLEEVVFIRKGAYKIFKKGKKKKERREKEKKREKRKGRGDHKETTELESTKRGKINTLPMTREHSDRITPRDPLTKENDKTGEITKSHSRGEG